MLSLLVPLVLFTGLLMRPAWINLGISVGIYIVFTAINNKYSNGIAKYPGPVFAGMTNIWRVRDAYVNGGKRPSYVRLHNQYGDVVRLGPKALSFANPAAIQDIYPADKGMAKSKWYIAFEAHGKGHKKENIFSTRDTHWHSRYRELVAPGFHIDHFGKKEGEIDQLVHMLLHNLDAAAASADTIGKSSPVDLPLNLQFFTFDAGGVVAFSQAYGFLQQKIDIDGIIQSVRVGSTHLNRLAQAPLGQLFFDKNPLALFFGFIAPPMAFAKKYLPVQRIAAQSQAPKQEFQHHDILDQYMKAQKEKPGVVTSNEIVDLGLMVVVPASEAVRTAIAVLVYQMLKHPSKLAKLQHEVDTILTDRTTIPSWHTVSTRMPYLDACIKETFRIHPSTGFMIERVVPPTGAVIDNHFVPGGTIVSCSQWVIHRHKPTYGADIETFRPERWIEASPAQNAEMNRLLCPFGFEDRLCLGRDVGLFEVYKVGATLFSRYHMELEKPNKDMLITWGNIVSVDFNVFLRPRKTIQG